jgi:hypothetical protein
MRKVSPLVQHAEPRKELPWLYVPVPEIHPGNRSAPRNQNLTHKAVSYRGFEQQGGVEAAQPQTGDDFVAGRCGAIAENKGIDLGVLKRIC